MPTVKFCGRQLYFDAVYYFSPLGNDDEGNGTQSAPFRTPTGAITRNVFLRNDNDICFILEEGTYSLGTDWWFNTQNKAMTDNIRLTILSETPERTIINGNSFFQLNQISGLALNINITNVTIYWNNIKNDLINFNSTTLPMTSIKFTNVLFKIGQTIGLYQWFFIAGHTHRGDVIFENCILDTDDSYQLSSINLLPNIIRGIQIINSLINQKLQLESVNNFINQDSCLIINGLIQSYISFPLHEDIAHKGNSTILNPDEGTSHLGVCGGQNAWHFNTYWYRFSYVSEQELYQIPLEQIKQHYRLHSFFPGNTLYDQINLLEKDVDTIGNKSLSYILNSTNTYNFLDFIESPHILFYNIDDSLLGNYEPDNVHKVLLEITTPFYNNNQLFIYKNGILLKENLQYEIKDNNTVLFYSLNLGDEVYVYIGWENYLNKIRVIYKLNEDGTATNKIDSIICDNISVKSQYNYDVNDKLVSQTLITKNHITQIRDYIYDKAGRLINITVK